jgi:hypothetical protein
MSDPEIGALLAEGSRRLPRAERGCPDSEVLGELALDQLPVERREVLVAHLESCPDCAFEFSVACQARDLVAAPAVRAARVSPARRWLKMAAALVLVAGGLMIYRLSQPRPATLRGATGASWAVTPVDGARLAAAPRELAWPEVAGARGYEVELFDAAFTRLARSGELASSRYELPGGVELRRGGVYFWRVTVRGPSAEPSARQFSFRLEP